MKVHGFSRCSQIPFVAVVMMGGYIFLMELLVMTILELLPNDVKGMLPEFAWSVIDPIMLSMLISPLLYILLLKPMRIQQAGLVLRQARLSELNAGLEQRVLERTHKLLVAQNELEQDITARKKLEEESRANNNMKIYGFLRYRQIPFVAVVMMGVSIFLMELLVMVILELLPKDVKGLLPDFGWVVIDPIMLSILVSPLLYILLLKPMRTQQAELELSQARLIELNAGLEQRVLERTHKLLVSQNELEQDIAARKKLEDELRANNEALEKINLQLRDTKNLLLQSDKMASVGQLAAGMAHEINNPIGYVNCNLGALDGYLKDMFEVIATYKEMESSVADSTALARVKAVNNKVDLKFLQEDVLSLMNESREGIVRVKKIVQDLKDFSRVESSDEWQLANLHQGLDSTLNIARNEIKYKADVKKEYGEIPEVECLPSQLNQVFMNLLVNAAQAIEEHGTITLRTGQRGDEVWVEVDDTGKGIAPEHISKIFDPFFTTKPIGKGTGLGLSLSYGIIQKHHGRFEVQSEVGKGTTFRVWLPVKHTSSPHDLNGDSALLSAT